MDVISLFYSFTPPLCRASGATLPPAGRIAPGATTLNKVCVSGVSSNTDEPRVHSSFYSGCEGGPSGTLPAGFPLVLKRSHDTNLDSSSTPHHTTPKLA